MKKRVLYLTNLPAPYKVEFFDALAKTCDLTVAYERVSSKKRDKKWNVQKKTHKYREIWLEGIQTGEEGSVDLSVIRLLRAEKYNVILINGYSSLTEIMAIIYLRIRGDCFGIVCDGLLENRESRFKNYFKTFLITSADFWLSSGEMTDHVLMQHGAVRKRIFRYPFSSVSEADIERKTYDRFFYKQKIGCRSKYMILYAGQGIYRKGIDILLDAVKGLDVDYRLYLVGTGNVAEADSGKIEVVPFLNKEDLKLYYMAADVFVLPSREDIWGLVINEALGYGTPVVATDRCGAALEMLRDGYNGAIVPIENAKELQQKINEILQSDYYESYTKHAVATAEKYTIEKMAEKTWNIIQMLC